MVLYKESDQNRLRCKQSFNSGLGSKLLSDTFSKVTRPVLYNQPGSTSLKSRHNHKPRVTFLIFVAQFAVVFAAKEDVLIQAVISTVAEAVGENRSDFLM